MKKLTRVNEGKMFCGVCAGIGKYFTIDPTLVRLGAVILTCMSGLGLVAYIIAAAVIPMETGFEM